MMSNMEKDWGGDDEYFRPNTIVVRSAQYQ
jgi:hypothetical protein